MKEDLRLKIDPRGRLSIPSDIRDEVGDEVILRRTPEGFLLIPAKQHNFLEEFRRIISSEPQRTGKPENWDPKKMKSVWLGD
ncbi:MAG: MraZ N-terminal domain containing protein [Aigarchaeota archaeon]|nr:MraZ N-terminal domain containing protein [Candidatus Pelearchaeum maunauluense]